MAEDSALTAVTRATSTIGRWRLLRSCRVNVQDPSLHAVLGVAADLPGGAQIIVQEDDEGYMVHGTVVASYLPGPLRVSVSRVNLTRTGERVADDVPCPAPPACLHKRYERDCPACFAALIRTRLCVSKSLWPRLEVPGAI